MHKRKTCLAINLLNTQFNALNNFMLLVILPNEVQIIENFINIIEAWC